MPRSLLEKLINTVNDGQSFWQAVGKLACKKKQPSNNITLESWYSHFKQLLEKNVNTDIEEEEEQEEYFNEELDQPITKAEIIQAIKRLKLRKSAGPDGLIGEFFKYSSDIIVNFLFKLFNKLFDAGIYPEEWSESIILPLYKKGDVNNVNNYRGISLSDISGKIYGSIVNGRLHKWVELHDLTGEHQAGFKRDHSTVDHIFTLLATVQKQLITDKKLYVAFIDFEKAFDSISRNLIWPILRKNGIRGKMLKCVRSMYNVVKAKVRSGAKLSDLGIHCTKGVKQGDVCSPILFSLFVNELALDIIDPGTDSINWKLDFLPIICEYTAA